MVNFLSEMKRLGAILENTHVIYTSGRHGSTYLNKDALFPHVSLLSSLCYNLSLPFHATTHRPEVVIGAVVGGVILSQWVSYHLGASVLSVYAEKDLANPQRLLIKRGFDELIRGKKVLLVEDIVTTGGTLKKLSVAVRECQGEIVGVSALCHRGDKNLSTLLSLSVPCHVEAELPLESWEKDSCPLCAAGVPINTNVGHGKTFLK